MKAIIIFITLIVLFKSLQIVLGEKEKPASIFQVIIFVIAIIGIFIIFSN